LNNFEPISASRCSMAAKRILVRV